MKLIHTALIVFTGLLFSYTLYAQGSTNEAPVPADNTGTQQTVIAVAEAPVKGDADASSDSPSGKPFETSPYTIILDKMPFGTPPDPAALNAAAAGIDEAKMKLEQQKLAETFSWTAINITPDGKTAIGFTDLSAKPPASYYMTVGESANNWTVIDADYKDETATIEKDGVCISLKFGNKSPIAGATPGQTPANSSLVPVSGHNHLSPLGLTPSSVETRVNTPSPDGGRTSLTSSRSALLTSYRDRLNERLKADEKKRTEADLKQKEDLSKIVTDALRRQQEEAAAAAAQQGDGQVQQIEVQLQ